MPKCILWVKLLYTPTRAHGRILCSVAFISVSSRRGTPPAMAHAVCWDQEDVVARATTQQWHPPQVAIQERRAHLREPEQS